MGGPTGVGANPRKLRGGRRFGLLVAERASTGIAALAIRWQRRCSRRGGRRCRGALLSTDGSRFGHIGTGISCSSKSRSGNEEAGNHHANSHWQVFLSIGLRTAACHNAPDLSRRGGGDLRLGPIRPTIANGGSGDFSTGHGWTAECPALLAKWTFWWSSGRLLCAMNGLWLLLEVRVKHG